MSFTSKPIFPFRAPGGRPNPSSNPQARPPSTVSNASSSRRPGFDSDGLPIFGSPNELPNPPSHYFPSRPAKERQAIHSRRWIDAQPASATQGAPNSRITPTPTPTKETPPSVPEATPTPPPNPNPIRATSAETEEGDGADDAMDLDEDGDGEMDDDTQSVTSNKRANTGKMKMDDGGDDEPAKKRSRTLTTAHQTAVLNALLAKTRFPSTETREEVGQQIGMSARRVQIWFQNRRQSQKRARDRDASDLPGSSHPYAHHPYSHSPHSSYGGSGPSPGKGYYPQQQPHPSEYGYPQGGGQDYLSQDPYANVRISQGSRPMVSRQGSFDSIASIGSFSSARTSQSARDREAYGGGGPGRVYAFPPPPTVFPSRPHPNRSGPRGEGEVKLPSLSAVLGPTPQQQQQQQYEAEERARRERERSPDQDVFAHRPPPLPAHNASSNTNSSASTLRATHQETDPNFDFARLRISPFSPPTSSRPLPSHPHAILHHSNEEADPDVLDFAMETMYRSRTSRVEPARSRLPAPPRFPSTFPSMTMGKGSEADAALRAPIGRATGGGEGGSGVRLPLINTLGQGFGLGEGARKNSLISTGMVGGREMETDNESAGSGRTILSPLPPIPANSDGRHGSVSSTSSAGGERVADFRQSSSSFFTPSTSSQQGKAYPPRSISSFSHASGGTGPPRTSIAESFDTASSALTSFTGRTVASSRTSFSSEVQEEWNNLGLGRK